jgi:Mg/Co/Ni transporter MgtE
MPEHPRLTLAFLTHAPQSAAQVLQELEPAQAAAFLEEVPARISAPVVADMSSWTAARCIERLAAHRAAAVLHNLPFHDTAGLLRLIASERRATILDALPARLSRRLHNALTYPAGSIGAWIDPEIPAFPESASVSDTYRYLSNAPVASHLFLHAGDDGRFTGAIPVTALMRSDGARLLSDLPIRRMQPLSSRATLGSVAFLDEWDEFLMLPVVGRKRTLVGGLSRAGLRKGLQEHRTTREVIPGTMTGHVLSALATTFAGVLRLATHAERPLRREH